MAVTPYWYTSFRAHDGLVIHPPTCTYVRRCFSIRSILTYVHLCAEEVTANTHVSALSACLSKERKRFLVGEASSCFSRKRVYLHPRSSRISLRVHRGMPLHLCRARSPTSPVYKRTGSHLQRGQRQFASPAPRLRTRCPEACSCLRDREPYSALLTQITYNSAPMPAYISESPVSRKSTGALRHPLRRVADDEAPVLSRPRQVPILRTVSTQDLALQEADCSKRFCSRKAHQGQSRHCGHSTTSA